ncbi:MAG: GntR family transcriptional regulator [Candidatus Sumerlaeota bacterium]|nr:GntR family transcriptional regulator [Candidatus Sumerlaeota bacterium]
MIIEIDTRSGVPIYAQVIEQIKRLILAGRLAEGAQIEQVRSLAARLKVNPMTISKAYSLLERDGLLERRRGVGLFIAGMRKDTQARFRGRVIEDAFRKAAAAAIQMSVSEQEASALLGEMYRKLSGRNSPRAGEE